jgi:hypothetical protein
VQRRNFLRFGSLTVAQAAAAKLLPAQMSSQMPQHPAASPPEGKADYTLRIAPVTVELAPQRILSTIGYNGVSPGPILRMREGKPVTVDVINNTDVPELVHWHGLLVPSDVDGVEEEATPFVPPQGRRRYLFTPRPAGSRFYVAMAFRFHRGSSPASSASFVDSKRPRSVRSGALSPSATGTHFTSFMETPTSKARTTAAGKPAVQTPIPTVRGNSTPTHQCQVARSR